MSYKKLIILLSIPLAMIVVWVFAVYLPIEAQAKKKQNMINSILQQRKELETKIASISQQMHTQESLKRTYNTLMSQTPSVDKMPDFMDGLLRDAKSRGMAVGRLGGFYDGIDSSEKGILNPVFEINLKGGFFDVGKFLESISAKSSFKVIKNARIGYDDSDNSTLTGKFLIEFKALQGRPGESK